MRRPWAAPALAALAIAVAWLCWRGPLRHTPATIGAGTHPAPISGFPAPAGTPSPAEPPPPPRQTTETVQLASGRTVRLIRRRSFPLPVGALAPLYRQLRGEADSGNALSAYRLGILLYQCRNIPASTAALEQTVDRMHQTRTLDGWDVDDPNLEEHALRQGYSDCAGIPEDERQAYRRYLKTAADAGVIEAELDLPLKLPPGRYCEYLSDCSPAQRARQAALQREAIDYVRRAQTAGSVAALWTLGGWYAGGEVLPEDDIEAYACFKALDEIHAAARIPRRFDGLLATLRQKLRPIDLDQANARADALLANPNCCVITP